MPSSAPPGAPCGSWASKPPPQRKGVAVVVVHTGTMADEDFKAWKQEAALPFPVGCLKGDAEKARAAWGAGALPWLILTDKAHRVTAEGFALEELDAKIKSCREVAWSRCRPRAGIGAGKRWHRGLIAVSPDS